MSVHMLYVNGWGIQRTWRVITTFKCSTTIWPELREWRRHRMGQTNRRALQKAVQCCTVPRRRIQHPVFLRILLLLKRRRLAMNRDVTQFYQITYRWARKERKPSINTQKTVTLPCSALQKAVHALQNSPN